MQTAIPADTIAAYLAADFIVDADPSFVMHIGERCDALAALYAAHQVDCCAFITACNPQGEPAGDDINQQRQQAFARTLEQRALAYLTGAGCDPKEQWPCEPSYLVMGTALAEAKAMGQDLKQNAIVWCGADMVPQLVLLR